MSGNLGICPGYSSSKFCVVETRDSVTFLCRILFLAASLLGYIQPLTCAFPREFTNTWTLRSPLGWAFAVCSAQPSWGQPEVGRERSQSLLFASRCGLSLLTSGCGAGHWRCFLVQNPARPWVDSKFEPLSMIAVAAHSWAEGRQEAAQWALLRISTCSSSHVSCSPGPAGSSLCMFWPEVRIVFCWRVGSMWANLQQLEAELSGCPY